MSRGSGRHTGAFLARAIPLERGELPSLLDGFLYYFLPLCSYYMLRPVRDEMGVRGGVENLQWLFTATFAGRLVAALASWLPRSRLIPLVYGLPGARIPGARSGTGVADQRPVQVIRRAGNYAIARPGREMLFTVVSRMEKYKAKNLIDTVIYRGGDAIAGWLFAGLTAWGVGLRGVALLAVPLAGIWLMIGWWLGQRQAERARRHTGAIAHDETTYTGPT